MDEARENFKSFFISSLIDSGKIKNSIGEEESLIFVSKLNLYVADIILKLQWLVTQNPFLLSEYTDIKFVSKLKSTKVYLSDYRSDYFSDVV